MAVCSLRPKRPRSEIDGEASQGPPVDDGNTQGMVSSTQSQTDAAHREFIYTDSAEGPVAGLKPQGSGPDIELLSQEALSDSERKRVLETKWAPTKHFVFPKNSQHRRYSHDWEDKYSWLRYSASCDGAYCSTCFCFAPQE